MSVEKYFIIVDNLRVYKKNDIQSITSEYVFLSFSPYSYMLNPIENAFSKIKYSVRSKLWMGWVEIY